MAEETIGKDENLTNASEAVPATPKKHHFCGSGFHSIDDKNRVKFPSEIRSQLNGTPFRLAKGNEHKIYVYPEETAQQKLSDVERLLDQPNLDLRIAKRLRKYVASFTPPMDLDGQDRFLLPQHVMDWAGFQKKDQIATIGFIDHFEIWLAEDYRKFESEDDIDDDDISYEEALASIKVY